ncbi:MAG: hypothetical protein ACMG51_05170, partial [Ginsengibacter sp.]
FYRKIVIIKQRKAYSQFACYILGWEIRREKKGYQIIILLDDFLIEMSCILCYNYQVAFFS